MLYYVNTKYILAAVAVLQQLVQSLKTLRCLINRKNVFKQTQFYKEEFTERVNGSITHRSGSKMLITCRPISVELYLTQGMQA